MKGGWPTIQQLKDSKVAEINPQLFDKVEQLPVKRSKYGNTETEVDGIKFDSAKEANRYQELLLLLKAGEIGLLRWQVEYELNPGGSHSLKYIADFVYIIVATGQEVVEDVKGYRTREYKKKKRLMKKVHGKVIKEI